MNDLQVEVTRASGEEVDLLITGTLDKSLVQKIWVPGDGHVTARVMSMIFSIETGLRVVLHWGNSQVEGHLILPLEGRGTLDFSKLGGLRNPRKDGWDGSIGIYVANGDPKVTRYFTLAIELSKMRT